MANIRVVAVMVTVWCTTGDPETFRDGDAANLKGQFFVVFKLNPKKHKKEDVEIFRATDVAWAEVSVDAVLASRVLGLGRRDSN